MFCWPGWLWLDVWVDTVYGCEFVVLCLSDGFGISGSLSGAGLSPWFGFEFWGRRGFLVWVV